MRGFILFLVFLLISTFFPQFGYGATAESVQSQINDINSQIQALDKEIAKYQTQITETSGQALTLANHVKELTLTRDKLIKEAQATDKKITATSLVIGTLDTAIRDEQKSINESKELLGQIFRDLDRRDEVEFFEKILSQDNLADASREYNNLLVVNEKVHTYVNDLIEKEKALTLSKEKKESEQQNLTTLKKTLLQKKQAVDITKKEKDTLLKETKNKESEYKKLLAAREKQRDEFEKSLEQYEAELKFILNPKLLPSKGTGALSWPLESIKITSPFGSRWGKFHYGTDFRASVGTKVMAMSSGVVLGTGDTDVACKGASFGKWVFIKYDNGLSSTYGHLSVISTTVGQRVEAGDAVALSGNTGSSTGPHLHVAVYASDGVKVQTVPSKSCNGKIFTQPIAALNAYLDPMLYLPKP